MNVLFIAVDTLRADHLGCFGYERNTSPHLDGIAAQSTVFERHMAPAIPTHPAFTTMNTGQYPITHGVVAHAGKSEPRRSSPWLPLILHRAGRTTVALDNLAEWSKEFRRGFEFYIDPGQKRVLGIKTSNRELNARAIPWLKQHANEKFYMFIHYWDPHTPYMPPRAYRKLFYQGNPSDPEKRMLEGLTRHPLGKTWQETWFNKLGEKITDGEYIEALYDSEIRYCDEGIGQLLKTVEEIGQAENTLVVILGDHGELMYRHGIFFDHHGLYDGNLHVPLIVKCPGMEPRRIPHLSSHADVAPTILDLCGIEIPKAMEGASLAPFVRGERTEPVHEFIVSEECTWQMKWSIRTDTHKFILARDKDFYGTPMRELYDLRSDPNEMRNIAREDPETARALEQKLEGWLARMMAKNKLEKDPLRAHGLSLGRVWQDERREAAPLRRLKKRLFPHGVRHAARSLVRRGR